MNYPEYKKNFIFILSKCDLIDTPEEEAWNKIVNKVTDGNMPGGQFGKFTLSNLNNRELSEDLQNMLRNLCYFLF